MRNSKKGFSLVELIVVVAIMAVLVGILAPTLTRYVEKTRIQKDESAVAELDNAAVIAMADETIYQKYTASTDITFTNTDGTLAISAAADANEFVKALVEELNKSVASEIKLSSKEHKAESYKLTIEVDDNGVVSAKGEWN